MWRRLFFVKNYLPNNFDHTTTYMHDYYDNEDEENNHSPEVFLYLDVMSENLIIIN